MREIDGLRWYRCVRCDSWVPLPPPEHPARETPPSRDEVDLPLRGKALRDKIVLRVIAIDRAIHFVVLARSPSRSRSLHRTGCSCATCSTGS